MAIERRRHENGTENVITTSCPFCGAGLEERENYAYHLRSECPGTNGGETA